jgi:hypothetical protein
MVTIKLIATCPTPAAAAAPAWILVCWSLANHRQTTRQATHTACPTHAHSFPQSTQKIASKTGNTAPPSSRRTQPLPNAVQAQVDGKKGAKNSGYPYEYGETSSQCPVGQSPHAQIPWCTMALLSTFPTRAVCRKTRPLHCWCHFPYRQADQLIILRQGGGCADKGQTKKIDQVAAARCKQG